MRASLKDARLTRYAGRFVWLELDFDKPANQDFIRSHEVVYTPTLFLVDARTDRATATNMGGLTLPELERFLDRGAEDAIGSRAFALDAARQYRECAGLVMKEAPRMPRDEAFVRAVLAGLSAADSGGSEPWAVDARRKLEPLAAEALNVKPALRDHRFQLYQDLMMAAALRDDPATLRLWGDRWLAEIDATKPSSEDERSALDIARVDAADLLEDPSRVLPALIASERAMPGNYNASLRLAQMFVLAKRYDEGIAGCDRGLQHVTGPLGRSWLLRTKADALVGKHDVTHAREALEQAIVAARTIGLPRMRESNIAALTKRLERINE